MLLGAGIGAALAAYSSLTVAALRPLQYPKPGELMQVWARVHLNGQVLERVRPPDGALDAVSALLPPGASVGAAAGGAVVATLDGTSTEAPSAFISPGLLPTLGLHPIIGRALLPSDWNNGASPAADIGEGLWRKWGGSQGILGRRVNVGGQFFTIVGVLPAALQFPGHQTEIWVPGHFSQSSEYQPELIFRRAPGWTAAAAAALVNLASARLVPPRRIELYAEPMRDPMARSESYHALTEDLTIIALAASLLLVLVLVNFACVCAAKAEKGRLRAAIMVVLGAPRSAIFLGEAVKSFFVAGAGWAVSLAVAWALLRSVRSLAPGSGDGTSNLLALARITPGLALAGAVVAALAWFVATVISLRLVFVGPAAVGGMSPRSGIRKAGSGGWLLATQTGLCILLALTATQLSLGVGYARARPGFVLQGALEVPLFFTGEPTAATGTSRQAARHRELMSGLCSSLVGRVGVSACSYSDEPVFDLAVEPAVQPGRDGYQSSFPGASFAALSVGPRFVSAAGLPLIGGRDLLPTDFFAPSPERSAPAPVIVNETFGRDFLPGRSVVGVLLPSRFGPDERKAIIVGEVRDSPDGRHYRSIPPTVYMPSTLDNPKEFLFVRSSATTDLLAATLQSTLAGGTGARPGEPQKMQSALDNWLGGAITRQLLMSLFAALALGLVLTGAYAYSMLRVQDRRPELAVRAALGASASMLGRGELSAAGRPLAVGLAGGLLASASTQHIVRQLIPQAGPAPLWQMAVVLAGVIVATVAAALPAALHAAATDPAGALRES